MASGVVAAVKTVKESSGYIMISAGGAMTQTPMDLVQIVGGIIGTGGLIVAVLRWLEAKRANDLTEEKWEYEKNAKSQDNQEAKASEAVEETER